MKLFYTIVLALMVLVSACAQQPAEQEAAPVETQPEVQPETVAPVEAPEEVAPESTSNDIRYVGAGGFDPAELTISAGSSVTWFNDDSRGMVIIVFKDGKSYENIPTINPGQQVEREFTEPGEYEYWWNIAYAATGGKITVE